MKKSPLRIVYMGTPDFAVVPLANLIQSGFNVVAVLTAPDRPAGRGKKIRFSPVKQYLLQNQPGIPMLQPSNLKDPDFLAQLQSHHPDLQVVVAFRMLPEVVWKIPRYGTFNLHASLLPQYRGAAPINHVLINGEKETGVTTFMIDEKIDTGNILLQESIPVGESETAGELHDRLMELGAKLVVNTVQQLQEGSLKPKAQEEFILPEVALKNAPKIHKEDCRIQWDNKGRTLYNLIRGLSPYPGAYTFLHKGDEKGVLCKIFGSSFRPESQSAPPGTFQSDGKSFLEVSVQDGWIQILSIQQEGKRRMEIRDFLAGANVTFEPGRFS